MEDVERAPEDNHRDANTDSEFADVFDLLDEADEHLKKASQHRETAKQKLETARKEASGSS